MISGEGFPPWNAAAAANALVNAKVRVSSLGAWLETSQAQQKLMLNYSGWKKSCTTLDGWNPVNNEINHLSTQCMSNNISKEVLKSNFRQYYGQWKSRGGKSQRRDRKKREEGRRKKIKMCGKVEETRPTVFFQCLVAPEGREVGSLKRQVRSRLGRWEMNKCT